jgi:hypothetical protein
VPEPAAVLLEHLARNHLPDANSCSWPGFSTRTAWRGPPDVGVDATVLERMAAGEAGHDEVVTWVRHRTREKGDEPPAVP